MATPMIRFHSSQTPSRLINAHTPSLRALFARKRRVRLAQLSLLRRSLARLARTELAYLDQSVYLSRLSLIRLTQQAVAANPAAWPAATANDERSNEWLRPPPHRLSFNGRRNDVRKRVVEAAGMGLGRPCWPMLGPVGDEVEVMETQIGRLRRSVGRLARIAASRVDEVKRVETGVEKMAAFREVRQGLVEQVRERLRVEERGWRRKGLVNKMKNLRAAEMWYVDKVVLASERELQVAESELEAVVEEIDEEQARRRRELNNREGGLRVGQKVRLVALRNPMDAVMERRAAQAWALAKDLEDCLGR
ncbi:hypothetical protein GTA08_BOTSDO01609 [Neofusicoccum parvum]|uniref:Uncharacterized protein n=1 Tax=Neofusicoccum parvum TaxID=310453 RepID=A0ACB5SHP6_9PEZI|nr:hypothetical protein GTA08_BOTSDO01609 [Neofusicoccum parvum]